MPTKIYFIFLEQWSVTERVVATWCNNIVARHYFVKNFQVTNILHYSLRTGGYYTTLHNLYISFRDQRRVGGS